MKTRALSICIVLLLAYSAVSNPADDEIFRVMSWNISNDAHVAQPQIFRSLLQWADPDIILLDEVGPSADAEELENSLAILRPGSTEAWTVNIGVSGGRQRGIIASRAAQESLPEFSTVLPYPDADRHYLREHMSSSELAYENYGMDGGIPVNGAIILIGRRRLLTVITDLQCCGNDQDSWQEYRRRVEAREIRRLIRQVLQRTSVDGIVIAGDFNPVNGPMPLVLLGGPYRSAHAGLISAEIYQSNGTSTWTWDGRQTPFPSGTLDYQLYGPQGLTFRSGFIQDTESLSPETLKRYGLDSGAMRRTGRHLPIVAEYGWSEQE